MVDVLHQRVLEALVDGEPRYVEDLCAAWGCTRNKLEVMAMLGLLRFMDLLTVTPKVCITPRGMERLQELRRESRR